MTHYSPCFGQKSKEKGTKFWFWDFVRDLGYEDKRKELLDKMKLKKFVEIHEKILLGILFYLFLVEGKAMGMLRN